MTQTLFNDITVQQEDNLHLPLVNRFYKDSRYSAKAGRGEQVYSLRGDGVIVAALRLQPKAGKLEGVETKEAVIKGIETKDTLFLRSMCVKPSYRGQGLGSQLLQGIFPALQGKNCFCYPFRHLQDFYAQAGFVLQDESTAADFMREPLLRYRQQGRDIVLMLRRSD